jgi:hypothetical protein
MAADWTFYTGGRSQIDGVTVRLRNTRLAPPSTRHSPPGHKGQLLKGANPGRHDIESLGVSYNLIWQKGQ